MSHDLGTQERHKKGDVLEYEVKGSNKRYARTINQLEHYEKIGWLDENHVKAGKMLYSHWWIGVKGEMPKAFNGMQQPSGGGAGLREQERKVYHKNKYFEFVEELTPEERNPVLDVCIWDNSLGGRRTSKKTKDFISGMDLIVKLMGY